MLHLEYFVIAFLVVAVILFAVAIAILFPYLQRERQADVAEIRELDLQAAQKNQRAS